VHNGGRIAFGPDGMLYAGTGDAFESSQSQDPTRVNVIEAGGNYGWPVVEGVGDTQDGRFTNPITTWSPSEASPSGIAIAGDTAYVAALRGQRLLAVPIDGTRAGEPVAHLQERYGRLRTVQVAPDGALLVTTSNTDNHIAPRAGDDRVLRLPAR
jgi:glucose/arabinose dehydrogenase